MRDIQMVLERWEHGRQIIMRMLVGRQLLRGLKASSLKSKISTAMLR